MESFNKSRNYLFFIPIYGGFLAINRVTKLMEEICELKREINSFKSLAIDVDKLKTLVNYHGSLNEIEKILKSSSNSPQGISSETIEKLEKKYGSLSLIGSRIEFLEKNIQDKESELNSVLSSIGGRENVWKLKGLLGSYETIENMEKALLEASKPKNPTLKSTVPEFEDVRTINELKKYGSLDDVKKKLDDLEGKNNELIKLQAEKERLTEDYSDLKANFNTIKEELDQIFIDVGGREAISKIKSFRDKYGSFDNLEKKILDSFRSSDEGFGSGEFSREDLHYLNELKKHGSFGVVLKKLEDLDLKTSEVVQLKVEKDNFISEKDGLVRKYSDLKNTLEGKTNEFNQLLIDVGGQNSVSRIKSLREEHGSFESISSKLMEFESKKDEIIQLQQDLKNLEKDREDLQKKFTEIEDKYQKILQKFGGEQEIESAENLRNNHASFSRIKEKMDSLPAIEEKAKKFIEIESMVDGDHWIIDQLKEKLVTRKTQIKQYEELIGDDSLKAGTLFEDECKEILSETFNSYNSQVKWFKEDKGRKDFLVEFSAGDFGKLNVILECKSITQYYKNSPLVLTPKIDEGEIKKVGDQIKKAFSKFSNDTLNVIVVSVPYERFKEYGINEGFEVIDGKKALIVSKSYLKPLLLSIEVICRSYIPILGLSSFEFKTEAYSNERYSKMLTQIFSNMKNWEVIKDKFYKAKTALDTKHKSLDKNFNNICNFFDTWKDLIESQHNEAMLFTKNEELKKLDSSIEVETEEIHLLEEKD